MGRPGDIHYVHDIICEGSLSMHDLASLPGLLTHHLQVTKAWVRRSGSKAMHDCGPTAESVKFNMQVCSID